MHKQLVWVPVAAGMLWASMGAAWAGDAMPHTGGYLGAGLGASRFSIDLPMVAGTREDNSGRAGKIYGGWRFNEHFGVETGFAHLGKFSRGQGAQQRRGSGRVVYAAVTARAPLSDNFAINTRLGVAQGSVSTKGSWVGGQSPAGTKRGLMTGVGVEYIISPKLAMTADIDRFAKVSNQAKATLVSVGFRASF